MQVDDILVEGDETVQTAEKNKTKDGFDGIEDKKGGGDKENGDANNDYSSDVILADEDVVHDVLIAGIESRLDTESKNEDILRDVVEDITALVDSTKLASPKKPILDAPIDDSILDTVTSDSDEEELDSDIIFN